VVTRVLGVSVVLAVAVAIVLVARAAVSDAEPTTTSHAVVLDAPVDADGWRIVFQDNFAGDELDSAWSTCHWWQVDGGCTIASNDEQQWYRPEAVAVSNGELALTATRDQQETTDGEFLPIRSGMVSTGPSSNDAESSGFEFTFGRVEVRAWLPAGGGTWPAFWLLSADKTSLPEIDILERYGNRPELATSHVHQRVDDERDSERIEANGLGLDEDWHTYSVDWSADAVVFAIDGIETGRVTDPELIPTTPMYLILNLAMGGSAGEVDLDSLPQTLRIDEVIVRRQVTL
jgi:beta-glucanase (GH16 family)